MAEIHASGPRLPASGVGSDGRARRQVVEGVLGWGQLLGRVVFWLVVDVLFGCGVYFLSCGGKECKDRFSGVTGNTFADSLYFSSTTLTTTGFGDIAPTAPASKALTSIYIVSNTFYINYFVYPPFVRLVQLVEGRNRGFWRRFVLAICYCLICLLSGIPFLICLGGLGWGNAAYTVVVSFSSTGYGDYTFAKMWGRVFNSLWLLVSHLVNYRLGGLITDAGDHSFLQDDGARDQAATTAAQPARVEQGRNAAAALTVVEQERDAAVAATNLARENLAVAERARDAAVAAQDLARENLAAAVWEKNAAVAAQNLARSDLAAAEWERDAAVAAKDSAREALAVAERARDGAVAAQDLARENLAVAVWEKNVAVAAQNLARSDLAFAEWERDAAVAAQDSAREALAVAEWERDGAVNLLLMGFLNILLFLLMQRFGL